MNTPKLSIEDLIHAVEDANLEHDEKDFSLAQHITYWCPETKRPKLLSEAPAQLLLEIAKRLNGKLEGNCGFCVNSKPKLIKF